MNFRPCFTSRVAEFFATAENEHTLLFFSNQTAEYVESQNILMYGCQILYCCFKHIQTDIRMHFSIFSFSSPEPFAGCLEIIVNFTLKINEMFLRSCPNTSVITK